MTADRLPPDDDDRRLSEALAGASLPATPADLEERVRGLIHRRRLQQAGVSLAAAAGLLIAALGLWSLTNPGAVSPRKPTEEVKLAEQTRLKDLNPLVAAPPVVTVAPDQDAWLAALEAEVKESK
ncbi:MAG: hypothetical protein AB7K24_28790 [Gemmataceae bacterium]